MYIECFLNEVFIVIFKDIQNEDLEEFQDLKEFNIDFNDTEKIKEILLSDHRYIKAMANETFTVYHEGFDKRGIVSPYSKDHPVIERFTNIISVCKKYEELI